MNETQGVLKALGRKPVMTEAQAAELQAHKNYIAALQVAGPVNSNEAAARRREVELNYCRALDALNVLGRHNREETMRAALEDLV